MSDGHANPPPAPPQGAGYGGPSAPPPPDAGQHQALQPPGQPWTDGSQPFGTASSNAASTWLALGAIVAIVLSVSIKEGGRNGWDDYALWAGFAIACAVALLAPVVRNSVNLTETRAWQVAAGGLAGLVFYWLLFVLPAISRNVSFAATLGVIAAGLAVWLAPGRPTEGETRSTW